MLVLIEAQIHRDGEFVPVGLVGDAKDERQAIEMADVRYVKTTHCRRAKMLDPDNFPYIRWWKEIPLTSRSAGFVFRE